uniref:Monoglyceride lipase n=1 Tax=Cajanus cajan TaxID=3821 RepID=A0A151U5Z3_CAJCA|nr:Monoglyceride lipase [Cajanus cajan]
MVHPVAEANEESPFGTLTPDEFYARHSVSHASEFITNPRGLKLFTQWWTPLPPTPIIGTLALVHGFTGESSWFLQLTAVYFAKAGFATCAIDHQGHGFSEGLAAHIPDINPVVDDCITFFQNFRRRFDPALPSFLYSEFLGGAIALLITLRPGAAAPVIPTWRVVPTRGSIPEVSFKVEWKRKLALASPRRTVARPRAATAQELLRICREVQERYEEVEVPFLVAHGGDDVVCDPACVEELFSRAASKDKTLKIYPGMWHQMVGEPQENVELVFGDMLDWLRTRAQRSAVHGGS